MPVAMVSELYPTSCRVSVVPASAYVTRSPRHGVVTGTHDASTTLPDVEIAPSAFQSNCSVNDVEDAVQESLILVSRKLGSLRSLECFASWVFRIVKRECNRLKRGRRMLTGEAITDEILPSVTPEAAEWRQDVASALESLPPHYREIVLLRDLEGLSIAELGERLGLTPMATKARLHRARALAREYLLA